MHPFIAQRVVISVSDWRCSIVMEYMDSNLRKLMDTRLGKRHFGANVRPFELHKAELIISKIALSMAYVHSRGVGAEGLETNKFSCLGAVEVKIVNFGMLHLVEESPESNDTKAFRKWC